MNRKKTGGKVGYYNGAIMALNRIEDEIGAIYTAKMNGGLWIPRREALEAIGQHRKGYLQAASEQRRFWDGVKKRRTGVSGTIQGDQ